MIAAALLVAAVADPVDAGRVVLMPTAETLPAGGMRFALDEVAVPSFSFGVTDGLELTAVAAYVPHGEVMAHGSAKILVDERGPLRVALLAGLGAAYPEQQPGPVAYLVTMGTVLSLRGLDGRDRAVDVHLALLTAVPLVYGAVDAVAVAAPGLVWRALPWLDVVAEAQLRGVVPLPLQSGVTLATAARFRWWRCTFDAGWIIDLGVIGPPLPIVSYPGLPVLNAALTW